MRGSMDWQSHELFKTVDNIGESKNDAKEAARANGAETWADVGKAIGVFSYSTADTYRDVWQAVGEQAKAEDGVRDMTKLEQQHIEAYLQGKIDQGVSYGTFKGYASAVEKLATALNRYAEKNGIDREYKFDLKELRSDAKTELKAFEGTRAYQDPQAAVAAMRDPDARLVASIQHEGGARVKEASHIDRAQLHGLKTDRYTGQTVGKIEVVGKGGKVRAVYVSVQTYKDLERAIDQGEGRFTVPADRVRDGLKDAAVKTNQDYNGSHGLRWNYAQERFGELQDKGLTREEALIQVSNEMGHNRADITEHYLR